jgi:hypothetical protein
MKIAISTGLLTEGDMQINSCQLRYILFLLACG